MIVYLRMFKIMLDTFETLEETEKKVKELTMSAPEMNRPYPYKDLP